MPVGLSAAVTKRVRLLRVLHGPADALGAVTNRAVPDEHRTDVGVVVLGGGRGRDEAEQRRKQEGLRYRAREIAHGYPVGLRWQNDWKGRTPG